MRASAISCKTYMAPHEDPDFFFRDVDKSIAGACVRVSCKLMLLWRMHSEQEEERRQAAMSASVPDDDADVQIDSDGKGRCRVRVCM
jgi:hypothetical protein